MSYRITYIAEQAKKELQDSLQYSYQYTWDDINDSTMNELTNAITQHNSDTTYTEAEITNLDLESIGSCYKSSARIYFTIGDGSFDSFNYTLTVDLTSADTTQQPHNEAEDIEAYYTADIRSTYYTADIRSTGLNDRRTIEERILQALELLGTPHAEEVTAEVIPTISRVQEILSQADDELDGAQWIEEEQLKIIEEAETAMEEDFSANFNVEIDFERLTGETILLTSTTVGIFVTWNNSATFNVYTQDGRAVDCFTRYEIRNLETAMDEAHDWMFDRLKKYFS